jgi:hypothetical protein
MPDHLLQGRHGRRGDEGRAARAELVQDLARRQHDPAEGEQVAGHRRDAGEDGVVDLAEDLLLHALDAVLEAAVGRLVAVDQVVPALEQQEAGAAREPQEVPPVGAPDPDRGTRRRRGGGHQEPLAEHQVDRRRGEAAVPEAPGGDAQVQAVVVDVVPAVAVGLQRPGDRQGSMPRSRSTASAAPRSAAARRRRSSRTARAHTTRPPPRPGSRAPAAPGNRTPPR